MSFSQVKLIVPDVAKPYKSGNLDYSSPAAKKANIAMMKRIAAQYGAYIRKWCVPLGIPEGVILGFIATESGGVMSKPNAFDATGLMQVTTVTAYDTVTRWSTEVKEPIPAIIQAEIKAKAPYLSGKPSAYTAVKGKLSSLLATDASYNILAGCMAIRWLSERFSANGTALFNRVLVAYNSSAYTSSQNTTNAKGQRIVPIRTAIDTSSLVASSSVPAESRAYLVKMLGKDGFLDLYYTQKLI